MCPPFFRLHSDSLPQQFAGLGLALTDAPQGKSLGLVGVPFRKATRRTPSLCQFAHGPEVRVVTDKFEIRRPGPPRTTRRAPAGLREPFRPRVTPAAERVDTMHAVLEFPVEAEPEVLRPARPAPLAQPAPMAVASPSRRPVPVLHGARLLWLALVVGACAPMVWLALRDSDRVVPPQTTAAQTPTQQTATSQTLTSQTPTSPSPPAPAPKDPIVLAAPAPQRNAVERVAVPLSARKPPETPRTIERSLARSRDNSRTLAARASTAARTAPIPSAAVAAPAFYGALLVVSEPSGARVFVNGRLVGSTPLDLHEVPVGSRVVRVEADGYEAWASAVRVVANQQTRIDAALRH